MSFIYFPISFWRPRRIWGTREIHRPRVFTWGGTTTLIRRPLSGWTLYSAQSVNEWASRPSPMLLDFRNRTWTSMPIKSSLDIVNDIQDASNFKTSRANPIIFGTSLFYCLLSTHKKRSDPSWPLSILDIKDASNLWTPWAKFSIFAIFLLICPFSTFI